MSSTGPQSHTPGASDARSVLSFAALLVGGSALLGLASRWVSGTAGSGPNAIGALLVVCCAVTVALTRRGHLRAAAALFLPIAWLMVGAISVARGGLYSGTVGLYLLCTVMAGVIVSARAAIAMSALSIGGCAALLWGEASGLIPANAGMSLFQRGLSAVLSLGVTTAVFLVALRRLRVSLEDTSAAREGLARANRELLEAKASLEQTVAQRTQSLSEARDQALAAARAKMTFLANMSHELRTPMNAIVGVTELLRTRKLDAEATEFVGLMASSADALVALLDDVLDLAKIEAGRLVVEKTPWDVRATVIEVVSLMTPQARKKGLDLFTFVADDVPTLVLGDRVRVRQVLLNLLGNALKFTDAGSVQISVSGEADQQLRFRVTDSGIGIATSDLDRLFQPFEQVDASTTRRFGGTGLGLAISRQLAELMGGAIGAISAPGQGSTFWFTVRAPRLPASAAAQAPAPERAPSAAALPRRVLVAEDNPTNQLIARTVLEQLGCAVTIVENGRAALEAFEREPFEVVLMDIMMPELDGLEATRRLRQRAGPQPWIIAVTASALPEDELACFEAGVDDFVSKPVKVEALRQALERARPPVRRG